MVVGKQHAEGNEAVSDGEQADDVFQVEVTIIHVHPFFCLWMRRVDKWREVEKNGGLGGKRRDARVEQKKESGTWKNRSGGVDLKGRVVEGMSGRQKKSIQINDLLSD